MVLCGLFEVTASGAAMEEAQAMPVPAAESEATSQPLRDRRYPWVTITTLVICTGVFVGIQLDGSEDRLSHWGYGSAFAIWNDNALWTLVSSAFVHQEVWHVGFNAYWLWKLGSVVEPVMGRWKFLVFLIATAFISSAAQLAFSDSTGIGASGVVYALFGFAWMLRSRHDTFRRVLAGNVATVFFAWLAVSWVILGDLVGNAAHLGGLLAGMLFAEVFMLKRKPRLAKAGAITLTLFSVGVSLVCPWSGTWWSVIGYSFHNDHEYRQAIGAYGLSLKLTPDQPWVLGNLVRAKWSAGDDKGASETLGRLKAVDPEAAARLEGSCETPSSDSASK
jgi:GlpG protein